MWNIRKIGLFFSIAAFYVSSFFMSCNTGGNSGLAKNSGQQKIGILLINHGSRSEAWRNSLLELEKNVKDSLLTDGSISGVKTAFMEYTEPSIATRLKEFDAEQYTDVFIVPVFLTVSTHSFDDIPTLIGQKEDPKSMELFRIEKMERYTPKARVKVTPLLDFANILKQNVLRRFKELSKDPTKEGLVLIAYGDKTYNTEWSILMQQVGEYVKQNTGITDYDFSWCGHIVEYRSDSTTFAVNKILQKKATAVVIPVLVAFDENFQLKIIGGGIEKVVSFKEKVLYKPDAILPDKNVEDWVIRISREYQQQHLAFKQKNN